MSELDLLQQQINALINDQTNLESSVCREKQRIRDENDKQRELHYQRRLDHLNSKTTDNTSTPGPGKYNAHMTTPTMKRPTGGLIQPLPSTASTTRNFGSPSNNRATTRNGGRSRSVQTSEDTTGANIDHDAVTRAQNLVRPRPVGIAGYKKSIDSVLAAAIDAQNNRQLGNRSTPGPSGLALLSRACTINPTNNKGSLRVGRVVLKSVRGGLIVQMSTQPGELRHALVLGGTGRPGTVSTGSRTVMSLNAVGSSIVFGLLGNRHVYTAQNEDGGVGTGRLYGKRPPANSSGTRFAIEMHATPLTGKPMHVILKHSETQHYVCRTSPPDPESGEQDLVGSDSDESSLQQQRPPRQQQQQQQQQQQLLAIPLACNSLSRKDAEIFRVFNYTPESGDYNTNLSINITKRHTPGYGFGSPPPMPSETPPPMNAPPTPTTPNYRLKEKKQPTTYRTPSSSRSTTFGRTARTGASSASGSKLEDDELYNWFVSGRMRHVILSTKQGRVLTAPVQEGASVHVHDKWPGTGQSVLSFCYIPTEESRRGGGAGVRKKNSADFALRNARGHYVVLRKDGTLGVQREPSAETEIAITVEVHRHSVRLFVGEDRLPLCMDEKSNSLWVGDTQEASGTSKKTHCSDLFRVHSNVEGGATLGLNDTGMGHVKPRVVGGGCWGSGPPTPQTPDNMRVPSEGMPTPYQQRSMGDWRDEDYYSDEEYNDDVPPPEMDLDRHVRPRVPGPAWAKPVEQQETGRKKRKLRSQQRGTPGPGTYDAASAMNKLRKQGHDAGRQGRASTTPKVSSRPASAVLRRKRAQRAREAASGGPGMYDTSLANGSKSLNAGSSTNSANAKRGGFSRSKRFETTKARRKVVPKKTTATQETEGNLDQMDIDDDTDRTDRTDRTDNTDRTRGTNARKRTKKDSRYGWHSGTKESEYKYDGNSDSDEYGQEYGQEYEGKSQLYESKMDSSPDRRAREAREQSQQKSKPTKNMNKMKQPVNLLDQIHVDDILEQEGAASALLAPADLNINAVKPRVKGTTWGHKSVAKNFKNYHALKRAKRRKQRELEIGPTDYDADTALKALVDPRITGGSNFAQEERSRTVSEKKARKIRSKQLAIEKQKLEQLIEKNPTLKNIGPNAILTTQLHQDWSEKDTNKPVFQYHEPAPLLAPALRAKKAKEREKQGSSRWLSTQLPEQWGNEKDTDDKKLYTNFDQQVGRESIHVRKKGSKRVERFDAPQRLGFDPLGPGHYEDAVRQQDAIDPLARVADRGVLSFGKRTGRHDGVGPFGERPTDAVELDAMGEGGNALEGQILDIDAGDRPNRKSAVAFTWRKSGKWNDEEGTAGNGMDEVDDGQTEQQLVLSPHDDYLKPRNDRGFYSFDKQLGRVNNANGDDSMGNDYNEEEDGNDYYNDQEELHLNPSHTPVEKRKDVGHAFSTRPRFPVSNGTENDDDEAYDDSRTAELLLSPKEDFFRKKLVGGISMDKQPSRGLTSPTAANEEEDGSFSSPYHDADYDVERGLDKLKGKQVRGGAHDFSKQKPRFDASTDAGNDDDDAVQLYLSPKEFDSTKKASRPALNWSKAKPRFSPEPDRNDEYYDDGSMLELIPTDHGTSNRSRSKKGSSGVAMSKSRPRWSPPPDHSGDAASANNDGETLFLDSMAAETSLKTKGKISPAGWHKSLGRNDTKKNNNVDTSDLMYSPDLDYGKKGGSASKMGSKKNGAGTTGWDTRKGRTPPRVVDQLTNAIEQLILSPTNSAAALRGQGSSKHNQGVKMRPPTTTIVSKRPKVDQHGNVDGGPSVDGDRLLIHPNDRALRKSLMGGVSMGAKKTIPRSKPPRPPVDATRKAAKKGKQKTKKVFSKTVLGIRKPKTAAEKLQHIARQQYLQKAIDDDVDALNGWD